MFDQTFVTGPAQTRKPWAVALSFVLQTLFAAVVVILPLLHIAALQVPERATIWLPLQAPPQPVRPEAPQQAGIAPRLVRSATFVAPRSVPAHIDMSPDLGIPETSSVIPGAGQSGPVLAALSAAPVIPPPPPTAKPSPPAAPLRVSGGAQAARLAFAPKPAYPSLAKAARVQGIVRLQAIISTGGAIRNLQVISGPPLLVRAAMEAVQQWRYQPTLLSGTPVEVATEIEVSFTLN